MKRRFLYTMLSGMLSLSMIAPSAAYAHPVETSDDNHDLIEKPTEKDNNLVQDNNLESDNNLVQDNNLESDSGKIMVANAGNLEGKWEQGTDGRLRYPHTDGSYTTSDWEEISGKYYYFDENGWMVTGWVEVDGKQYYHAVSGERVTGICEIEEKTYFFQEDGSMVTDYWLENGGKCYYFQEDGTAAIGWRTIQDKKYYFYDSGAAVTGWLETEGKKYHFDENGVMETGWVQDLDKHYFLDDTGAAVTGWRWIGEHCYYFYEDGSMAVNTWIGNDYVNADGVWDQNMHRDHWEKSSNGRWWYPHADGSYTTSDWETIEGKTYYFDENGWRITGWRWINENCYYFYEDGSMAVSTWIRDDYVNADGAWVQNARPNHWEVGSGGRWWYPHTDGSYTTSDWEKIDGQYYYFDENGWMTGGWIEVGGKKYYHGFSGERITGLYKIDGEQYFFQNDGSMATEYWLREGRKYYYFQEDGTAATGWKTIQDQKYYFDKTGIAIIGWTEIEGKKYYFNENGCMMTGWIQNLDKRYFLDETGVVVTGWHRIEEKYYYFNEDGSMAVSTWIGDDYVDENGVWDQNRSRDHWESGPDGRLRYLHADGSYTTSDWEKIDGKSYYFDESGWAVTGWRWIGGSCYYFYEDGSLAVSTWIGNDYVNADGVWDSSMHRDHWELGSGGRWWYPHADGSYTTSDWEKINGKTYYFDQAGWMVTGWRWIGNNCYYFNGDGSLAVSTWIGNDYVNADGAWDQNARPNHWEVGSGGRWWYPHTDGSYTTSDWEKIDGKYYYFDENGWMTGGWIEVGGKKYYHGFSGERITGICKIDGKIYYFQEDGSMVTDYWLKDNGKSYYFQNDGTAAIGWHWIGANCYYFNEDGSMAVNTWIGGSYVNADGIWDSNMRRDHWELSPDGRWWYPHADGSYTTSDWEKINGKYYYFDQAGWMVTGWRWIGDSCYYFNTDGSMAADTWIGGDYVNADGAWEQDMHRDHWAVGSGGRWWYIHADGSYTTSDWEKISGKYYYFDQDGWMITGWRWIGDSCYYFNTDGSMAANTWIGEDYVNADGAWEQYMHRGHWEVGSGGRWWYPHEDGGYTSSNWEKINGKYYYFDQDGWMVTGWRWIDKNYYYFYADGSMAADTWVDGYYVDKKGRYIDTRKPESATGWKQSNGRWYYIDADGKRIVNRVQKIDGKEYHFDENGWMTTGWEFINGYWYYFLSDGSKAYDYWVDTKGIGGYYINKYGKMVADGTYSLGNVIYLFGKDGKCTDSWDRYIYVNDKNGKKYKVEYQYSTDTKIGDTVNGHVITEDDFLAAVVFTEAGVLGMPGMTGVAMVLLNRMYDSQGMYPSQPDIMVYQAMQFEVTRNGSLNKWLNNITSSSLNQAKEAVRIAKKTMNEHLSNGKPRTVEGIVMPEGKKDFNYWGFMTKSSFINAGLDYEKTEACTYGNTVFYTKWITK